MRLKMEAALLDMSLTPGQYAALSFIAVGPISAAELARRIGVTPQTMSEMIVALERKDVIGRVLREDNRRIADIELTDAGRTLYAEADARVDRLERELLMRLSPRQTAQLRRALQTALS